MEFHHHGYESTDPRIRPAEGSGIDRPAEVPDEVDVLIVGSGPAAMLLAAQLARFPEITTRIIERRDGRLQIGQADGIQSRTVETFQAFGFAERIIAEAYRITETAFWKPDPAKPSHIICTTRTPDDANGISEFPHLVVNQARVLDYFAEAAVNAPARVAPDYGWEFLDLELTDGADHPVTATLRRTAGPEAGALRTVRAKYLVGGDGARSQVRASIGRVLEGDSAFHAWGVLDVLANTDFPDVRTKSAIQSHDGGNLLLIPREGGYLFRLYVDLGEVAADDDGAVRQTPIETIIERANTILHPYSVDVKSVAWHSVYEVGHRLADGLDDVPAELAGSRHPRVFLMGDACHTHSAKAGQGMNVSMQDGFNLGWKLGAVLRGLSPETLLSTYAAERSVTAKDLIDFDKKWSTLMATPAEELEDPSELERFYVAGAEFSNGFKTEYAPSMIVGDAQHQHLASGYPIGKRFKSAEVVRRSDANPVHLGHLHEADGRWRITVFADAAAQGAPGSAVEEWGEWLATAEDSPLLRFTPQGRDEDAVFDIKVVYQQDYTEVEVLGAPRVFTPVKGPLGLVDLNKVFSTGLGTDIFAERGISRDGAVVVVRPDMYVAAVLPLSAREELAGFFSAHLLPQRG